MMQKTTLLLDLDDTLLDTNIQAFVPAYFQALSSTLADEVSPEIMIPALTGGTKAMMENQDPAKTLREVFNSHFFPLLGVDKEAITAKIDHFYDKTFPALGYVASQRPEAISFVRWAFENNHRVAIATNPYFPLKAVQHRMNWAGLPAAENPFALVSSYETFHFTKESPTYFLEFLAQLGCPVGPVVMVGNDLEMDLLPAQKAGLAIFWIRNQEEPDHPEIPQGSFYDLQAWLEKVDPESITPQFTSPESILHLLTATPAALGTLVEQVKTEEWHKKPTPEDWCLTEVMCHLRDVESEVNLPRVEKITLGGNPFLPGVNSDEWVLRRNYRDQDGMSALQSFIETRKKTLQILRETDQSWGLPARHAIFGPTTLLELEGITAGHDRVHIQQVWKLLHA
jgi:FMN phosphatase YigB (HAD superfamily)